MRQFEEVFRKLCPKCGWGGRDWIRKYAHGKDVLFLTCTECGYQEAVHPKDYVANDKGDLNEL